jgi:hypothetical protein
VIGSFFAIQLAALGLGFTRGSWPWPMFSRARPVERRLEAVGFAADGTERPIPLAELFRYTAGFTPMRAYDASGSLFDRPEREPERQAFARFLARKMAERGLPVARVELAWRYLNLSTGASYRVVVSHDRIEGAP